jgi:hypothetical protein
MDRDPQVFGPQVPDDMPRPCLFAEIDGRVTAIRVYDLDNPSPRKPAEDSPPIS